MLALRSKLARGFNSLRYAAAIREEGWPTFNFLETEEALEIVPTPNIGHKAIAKVDIPAGTCINEFDAPVHSSPTMHTVQINAKTHIAPTRGAEFISHGCEVANTRVLIDDKNLVGRFFVTKDVMKGEDLFFNYNTTEWNLSCPFQCQCPACAAKERVRLIRGFKYLSIAERLDILHETSPFIRNLATQECLEHIQMMYEFEKSDSYYDIERAAGRAY